MRIKITHGDNSIHLRGDLGGTAILKLSLRGIMRHTGINAESNLCLTKNRGCMGAQIEVEKSP